MKRFLLDTGIAGDFMNRRLGVFEKARHQREQGHKIGIGIPVLAELHFGVEFSTSREKNLRKLRENLKILTVWPFTEVAAEEYGRLAAELRRIGRPMQQIDIMIAAIAMTLGNCVVVSKDSDLVMVPGLKVENWAVLQEGRQ
jgi:tRNA(fMet)-specific endonuclease VapC